MLGRLFLKIIPWWIFAIIGVGFLPLTVSTISDTLDARAEAELARSTPPPVLLPIAKLTPSQITAPLDELHLSGRPRTDIGPWERKQKGVNFSYLIVVEQGQSNAPRYILLYFESYLSDLTLERLAAQTNTDGTVELRGFVSSRGISLPPQDWLQSAVPNGQLQAIVLPYFGDRGAAIDEFASDSVLIALIACVFNLTAFGAAFGKFRAWRKRVAARRGGVPANPKPQKVATRRQRPRPAHKVTAPSTTKRNDGFDNSPIQSPKKGWF